MESIILEQRSRTADNNSAITELYSKYVDKIQINPDLNRSIVSFQANKKLPLYRWIKYKEAFSTQFVRYILKKFRPKTKKKPTILDPFAGIGTALTTASKEGWKAIGIELLPIGSAAVEARLKAKYADVLAFSMHIKRLKKFSLTSKSLEFIPFNHLKITKNAFPDITERELSGYLHFMNDIVSDDIRYLFWFACLSILEEVSFTRKDGQYLRWDSRSGRKLKSNFDKGEIKSFKQIIIEKLEEILEDLNTIERGKYDDAKIIKGSCLTEIPKLKDKSIDLVITSPPYCNRYDYTRTYALELAFMNYREEKVKELRQTLLSSTVENKSKREQLEREYKFIKQEGRYVIALNNYNKQYELFNILNILKKAREEGNLNNRNIPNMVENYFFEMNLVIHELARVLTKGGHIIMVNDNVQYIGEEIPVDLILSDMASKAGLDIDSIWVLPKGKGNSSQQMFIHGRKELRKCVYVWSKL